MSSSRRDRTLEISPEHSHTLDGFPAAAVAFVRALEINRQNIAEARGLNGSELRALFHIAEVVSATPKQLAEHLMMTTGAITAIASRLVDAGLLQRVDHPQDRRSLYLRLTPLAHTTMFELHSEFSEMIAASTSRLTPDELDAFTNALWTVADEVRSRTSGRN